jgi:hypothetical protein
MLGLKSFRTAAVVIGGIELAEKIKKGLLNYKATSVALARFGPSLSPVIWRSANTM